jgi:hypothetical protein
MLRDVETDYIGFSTDKFKAYESQKDFEKAVTNKLVNSKKCYIKQNDGYDFVIEGEFNSFIFNGDYVEKDSIIGEYFEPFTLYFYKDDKLYSYEEYIRNSF